MKTFRHEDGDHDWLTIAENEDEPGSAIVRCAERRSVEVTPDAIGGITAALYEACGQQPPAVALGPVSLPADGKWHPYENSMLTADLSGRQVRISFDQVNGPASSFPPAKARELAAVLIALADEAESEPDPAEVDELAAVLRDKHAGYQPVAFEDAARDALRWMSARKAPAS